MLQKASGEREGEIDRLSEAAGVTTGCIRSPTTTKKKKRKQLGECPAETTDLEKQRVNAAAAAVAAGNCLRLLSVGK